MEGGFTICGGTGNVQNATSETQEIIDKVKHLIETRLNKKYAQLTALQFKSQVVAGTNFFIKVRTPDNDHFHVRVFRGFDDQLKLHGVQTGKSASDSVDYFDAN